MAKIHAILKYIADGSVDGRKFTEIQRFIYEANTGIKISRLKEIGCLSSIRGYYSTSLYKVLPTLCYKKAGKYVLKTTLPKECYVHPYAASKIIRRGY